MTLILEDILESWSFTWHHPASHRSTPRHHRRYCIYQRLCWPNGHLWSRLALKDLYNQLFNHWCKYLLLCIDCQENAQWSRSHRLHAAFEDEVPHLDMRDRDCQGRSKEGTIVLRKKPESGTLSSHQGACQASPHSRWWYSSHEHGRRVSNLSLNCLPSKLGQCIQCRSAWRYFW